MHLAARRFGARGGAFVFLFFAASAWGDVPNPEGVELSNVEREVIQRTNDERLSRGLNSLTVSRELMERARKKSANMAAAEHLHHGVEPLSGDASENIAWNQKTPADVMHSWPHSSGHLANMLGAEDRAIGVAVANQGGGNYWTQLFR